MVGRIVSCLSASVLLVLFSPILLTVSLAIFLTDGGMPFYISKRMGRFGTPFYIWKFRTMSVNASANGVNSTALNDTRITPIGKKLRRFKLDELPQLFNVLLGSMRFVGPRPNVEAERFLYTGDSSQIFCVTPGITDYASIVFSNEGEILKGSEDPDADYRRIIWPLKSRLGVFYAQNNNLISDFLLCLITLTSIFSRQYSLELVIRLLEFNGAGEHLLNSVRKTK